MTEKKQISAPKSADASMERLVRKMYISNVAKRLRSLNQPTDNDRRRWVWELIQNAKDSIAGDPQRSTVNIRIEIDGDTVRFRHNGNPFTMDARFGLLWKYSEDKENQESTGRFGTGFLTTHSLSKIVGIESNVYDEDAVRGFSVTMFRDGQTEAELLEGLDKMKESEQWFEEPFEWTTFTYKVNSESGRRAIVLGVESFIENIVRTMLFCDELGSVVLDYNGAITTIERVESKELTDGIILKSFEFINDGVSTTKLFLEKSIEEESSELSKRYKANRKIRLDIALELSDRNSIGGELNKLSYFCALPLVGVESQLDSPVIINSPDFEPDEERQSLLLNGITWNEESNTITEIGINRLIFAKTISLYDDLVKYVSENSFANMHLLARGLKKAKEHDKLDTQWYTDEILKSYRESLSRYDVVNPLNGTHALKINDCVFIKESSNEKENALFNLAIATHGNLLAADNHNWSSMLWKDGVKLWGLKDFCVTIEAYKNCSNIIIEGTTLYDWYNQFLAHVKATDENLLKDYAIIPDCNGSLKKKDAEGFKQGENISDFIINLLAGFGQDMKGCLLNKSITAVSLEYKYNSQSYSADINKHVKEITSKQLDDSSYIKSLLPLISIIPSDNDRYGETFINKRKKYHKIIVDLFAIGECETIDDNSLLKSAWENLDTWIKSYCLRKIEKYGNLASMPEGLGASWLSDCIRSLEASYEDLNKYKVLPNQNGVFCLCGSLAYDENIPECLKVDILKKINIDYKSCLLHGDFDYQTSKVTDKKTIDNVCIALKNRYLSHSSLGTYNGILFNTNYFDGHYHRFPEATLLEVAFYICSILPEVEENIAEKLSWKYKQFSIYALAKQLLPVQASYDTSYIVTKDDSLWKDVNEYVLKAISGKLETLGNLTRLSEYLDNSGEKKAMDLLNIHYSCGGKGKIYPNQNGVFKSLSNLKQESENICDMLKDIIALLVIEDESYRNILADSRCVILPNEKVCCADAYKLIDDKVDGMFKVNDNWSNESFKNAIHLLIEEWAENNASVWDADHFPKIYDKRDRLLMNVVWTKEERQSIQKMKKALTSESIGFILENATEIMNLSSKLSALEEENKRLKTLLESSNGSVVGADENGQLSKEEILRLNIEARTIVKQQMEEEGFIFDNGIGDYSVVNGVHKNGIEFPLVIKSCLGAKRRIFMTPAEWEQLCRPNSMLWLYFGNQLATPIKAYDLISYHDRLSLSFGSNNLMDAVKVNALMKAFRYLKDVHLDLVSVNPYKETGRILESYLFNSNNVLNSNTEQEEDNILPGA